MTTPGEVGGRPALNESQRRRLLVSCQYVDRLLVDIETILAQAASPSPFGRYRDDLAPAQKTLLRDYLARIRRDLVAVLARHGLQPAGTPVGVAHAVRTTLGFVDIAIEELRPKYMRGYGAVPAELVPELEGLVEELQAVVHQLDATLAERVEADFEARLARLEAEGQDVAVLQTIERIVSRHGLVEFRPALASVLERLEERGLEVAVFGRVSSGKSSLLNFVLGAPVLPVGVTPITTVPTRLVRGDDAEVVVTFADRRVERHPIARLDEFVTERANPGNAKHVARIVVSLPSARLQPGVVLVDTPGLGSLATAAAAETLAYLPRCDLGVLLIDATAPVTAEDVATLERLRQAAIPTTVLLSKADLLSPADLERVRQYVETELAGRLGSPIPIRPISVAPGAAHLAAAWVDDELQRWLDEHARLAERSLRRKIGALKTGVEAALRAGLERATRREARPAADTEAAQKDLREAAAAFEATRLALEPLRSTSVELVREAVAASARAVVDALWRSDRRGEDVSEVIQKAVARVAAGRAEDARRRLEALAEQTAAALRRAARTLELPEPPTDEAGRTVSREIPQVDLQGLRLERPLGRVAWLGRRAAEGWVARAISRRLGSALREALETHGVLVHGWAIAALAKLRRAFEAEAEVYRAHLSGMGRDDRQPADDPDVLARDLEALVRRSTEEP